MNTSSNGSGWLEATKRLWSTTVESISSVFTNEEPKPDPDYDPSDNASILRHAERQKQQQQQAQQVRRGSHPTVYDQRMAEQQMYHPDPSMQQINSSVTFAESPKNNLFPQFNNSTAAPLQLQPIYANPAQPMQNPTQPADAAHIQQPPTFYPDSTLSPSTALPFQSPPSGMQPTPYSGGYTPSLTSPPTIQSQSASSMYPAPVDFSHQGQPALSSPYPSQHNRTGSQTYQSNQQPPLPPPSNYWKEKASTGQPGLASPQIAPNSINARILKSKPIVSDYSDLDYTSMDFAYSERFQHDQQQNVAAVSTEQKVGYTMPKSQFSALHPHKTQPHQPQQPQMQTQLPSLNAPPQSMSQQPIQSSTFYTQSMPAPPTQQSPYSSQPTFANQSSYSNQPSQIPQSQTPHSQTPFTTRTY